MGRDFRLLWTGQVLSSTGSWISAVALPLLVLDVTGFATDAGLVRFAGTLPLLLFALPAGPLVDRFDRRRVLLACELLRVVALGILLAAFLTDRLGMAVILVMSALVGIGATVFQVAERAALRQLVPADRLTDAVAQNIVRFNVALVVGQAAGGVLYALGRIVPFAVDFLTYLVSLGSIALIRTPLQERREAPDSTSALAQVREGLGWVWRSEFVRVTTLLNTANNLVVNALYLAVIVAARERGAGPGEIGGLIALVGVGGLAGGVLATRLAPRVSLRGAAALALGVKALLIPALVLVGGTWPLGVLFGAMFLFDGTWGAALGGRQIALVPDRLQGRVAATIYLFAIGAVPLASIAVGAMLDRVGTTATIAGIAVVMLATTVVALASRTVAAYRDADPAVPA